MIKEGFEQLKISDKQLIFELVHKESGVQSNDPIWGEHHVFDDMNIFYRAVRKAVRVKFEKMSLEEKNAVCGEVYRIANPETDPQWGQHHAFDNELRLVDAMDKVESANTSQAG
jgi:hypothetical protein